MPFFAAAAAAVLLVGVGAYSCSKRDNNDRLSDSQVSGIRGPSANDANGSPSVDPARRCASGKTYELLKRELFRRAAQIRGSADPALFDRIATAAALRVERPVVTTRDEGLGSITCAATASLDLPPGLAVSGGRTSLKADLDYTLQPAADGSGDVLAFTNADAIVLPLATIGRQAASKEQVNSTYPTGDRPGELPPPLTVPRPSPPPSRVAVQRPAPDAAAVPPISSVPVESSLIRPSFNCASARTRGELAVCRSPGLAALDRQMAAQFRAAMSAASAGQREALVSTGRRFIGYRDNCPTESCIAGGYRDRMREIDDIIRDDRL